MMMRLNLKTFIKIEKILRILSKVNFLFTYLLFFKIKNLEEKTKTNFIIPKINIQKIQTDKSFANSLNEVSNVNNSNNYSKYNSNVINDLLSCNSRNRNNIDNSNINSNGHNRSRNTFYLNNSNNDNKSYRFLKINSVDNKNSIAYRSFNREMEHNETINSFSKQRIMNNTTSNKTFNTNSVSKNDNNNNNDNNNYINDSNDSNDVKHKYKNELIYSAFSSNRNNINQSINSNAGIHQNNNSKKFINSKNSKKKIINNIDNKNPMIFNELYNQINRFEQIQENDTQINNFEKTNIISNHNKNAMMSAQKKMYEDIQTLNSETNELQNSYIKYKYTKTKKTFTKRVFWTKNKMEDIRIKFRMAREKIKKKTEADFAELYSAIKYADKAKIL